MHSTLAALLLGAGTLTATTGHAQRAELQPAPFRKANTLVVLTSLPADSVLDVVARTLQQRGFQLPEPAAGQGPEIRTLPGIEAGVACWPLVIRAEPISGGVRLTGRYQMPEIAGAQEFPAEFLGFEWSPAKCSFRQVERIAQSIPRATITYGRY
ncbi:hypothetical protein [Hymenobacter metallicola]|uniref:Uncharacterized protein n=1 Tax=Hymenobacter metallicola TaxID=2563114 RepID=A0A4Z0Q163_9BACT|nr:hypothetical protein [Hymenobacter metallicola]TGE22841.1 hypothetical protein E5K02_20980 [Hymenobacter metallicola]